ncbi:MAG: M23 family metallopeptidase [Myxococcota bacterium]
MIVRHCEGAYGFYAHLIPGSLTVQKGAQVVAGQRLGTCGNSGNSSEPHFHIQDGPNFFTSRGVPVCFGASAANPRGDGFIRTAYRVAHSPD